MKPFVFALATLALADSVSYMIITPSLAFYVASLGGSQDFYGFVLSIYSFMSFCGKPILGRWSDASGFKAPYMVSSSLSVLGGFLYAIAPAFDNTKTALASVALGRIFGGLGRANSALNFAYIARACSAKERTPTTVLLGGIQTIGMAIAPLFSAFLVNVDFTLFGLHFDKLNSVGLLLVMINLISQVMIHVLLPDLPPVGDDGSDEEKKESEWLRIFRCILGNPHISVPFLTIFTFNFSWQLVETALAPAALDALGWGTVKISFIMGGMAVLIFVGMITVHKFSSKGVSDFKLLRGGLTGNMLGYILLYMVWYRGVNYIAFVAPVLIVTGSFPFLGAPNRSLFSEAVDVTPDLTGLEGTMQALLSMSSSVGGFTAPSVITHYWLRTPEAVSLSHDKREFTNWVLLAPLFTLVVLAATSMAGEPGKKVDETTQGGVIPDETTPLEDGRIPQKKKRLSLVETGRRASAQGSMCSAMTLIPIDEIHEDDY